MPVDSGNATEFKNSGTAMGGENRADPIDLDKARSDARRRKLLTYVCLATMVLVGAGGYLAWSYLGSHEETDDAFVDGHSSSISSRVEGVVCFVGVTDNQFVKEGELLARLDSRDYQVRVDQSKAAVDLSRHKMEEAAARLHEVSTRAFGQKTEASGGVGAARASLAACRSSLVEAEAFVAQKRSEIAGLKAKQHWAAIEDERYKRLDKTGAVSHRDMQQARTNDAVASAQLEGAEHELREAEVKVQRSGAEVAQAEAQIQRSMGAATQADAEMLQKQVALHQLEEAKATVAQCEAALQQELLRLSYTEIRAPLSGRVGRKNLEVGQRVETGQPLLSIFADHPWVIANFKETQVGRMHTGDPAEIRIDTFGGVKFKAHVDSIAPASGAKYALLPPENATGNFTKVVQRIPVKLLLDLAGSPTDELRMSPGMSCEVTVVIR